MSEPHTSELNCDFMYIHTGLLRGLGRSSVITKSGSPQYGLCEEGLGHALGKF